MTVHRYKWSVVYVVFTTVHSCVWQGPNNLVCHIILNSFAAAL